MSIMGLFGQQWDTSITHALQSSLLTAKEEKLQCSQPWSPPTSWHPCQDQPATDNPTTGAESRNPTDKRAFWTGKVWASLLTISILLLRPTHCTPKHLIFLWLLPWLMPFISLPSHNSILLSLFRQALSSYDLWELLFIFLLSVCTAVSSSGPTAIKGWRSFLCLPKQSSL